MLPTTAVRTTILSTRVASRTLVIVLPFPFFFSLLPFSVLFACRSFLRSLGNGAAEEELRKLSPFSRGVFSVEGSQKACDDTDETRDETEEEDEVREEK